jgi:2',3'-cyclic-nucleotide 2'-phosphodiesterase / 3'-nucleotidase / 5'-nucleotidase
LNKKKLLSIGLVAALIPAVLPFTSIQASQYIPASVQGIFSQADAVQNISIVDVQDKMQGNAVVIKGQTTFSEVTLKVLTPSNLVLYFNVVKPVGSNYETRFTLPIDAELGKYTIVAGKGTDVATDTFMVVKAESSNGNGNGNGNGTTQPEPYVNVETPSGNTIIVKVDPAKVDEYVKNNPAVKTLQISVPAGEKANVEVPASTFSALSAKNPSFAVQVNSSVGSYTLPVKEITSAVSGQSDKIMISINKSTDTNGSVAKNKFTSVSPVVEFKVEAVSGTETKEIKRFVKYVERSINLESSVNPSRSIAVRINEDGTLSPIPTRFVGNKAIFKSLTNSQYVIVERTVNLKDISKIWNNDEIESLAAKGIINGFADGSFKPNDTTTRLQLAVILTRSLGLTSTKAYDGRFKDVAANVWYSDEIMAAVEAGIINGKSKDQFDPNAPVNREQAAAMIKRALDYVTYEATGLDSSKTVSAFKDKGKISSFAEKDIEFLLQADIISGKKDGNFDPKGSTTRAQIVKMVNKALQYAKMM